MLFDAGRYVDRACNCFVAGTEVDTPDGPVPIESIEEGNEILTRHQDRPDEPVAEGRVTRVFRDLAPVILWLTLANGEVIGATPGHEVWTHQDGWTAAGAIAPGDTFLDGDGCPVEIIDVSVDPNPTPVYNLEVDGTFTYFAEGVWVHNNSCAVMRHHLLPRQFDPFFRRAGLNIEDFVIPLEGEFHKALHGKGGKIVDSWNGRWRQFFNSNANATRQQILDHYAKLFDEFFLH